MSKTKSMLGEESEDDISVRVDESDIESEKGSKEGSLRTVEE